MARITAPFGPQHPVLPEPVHLNITYEDEKVVDLSPALGYVHRGLEKLAERKEYPQNVFLVERVCGICSFMHAMTYCMGIEELMGIEIPARAKYLRVFYSEISRIHSHLLWLGLFADAFGFENLFMQYWAIREKVVDLMEMTGGQRVILSSCAIGGIRRDLNAGQIEEAKNVLQQVEEGLMHLNPVMMNDYTVKKRTVGKGILNREDAICYGMVGPVLRASGVAQDLRQTGYAAYGELDFEPVVERDGDCYARALVRVRESFDSIELARQALDLLPEGEAAVKVKGNPEGETLQRVEQPRGEVLYYIKANGSKKLERLRIRTPTFAHIPGLLKMLPGCSMADVPVILLSIDPCISCTER
ncbi:MAG TPA: nickel-dependent hydrogenase large subunit [Syntrophomonadaceae bacterium]|nr:nickel-dependent hydrogenase large subunit [Syntrophomonadaceae bacterium]